MAKVRTRCDRKRCFRFARWVSEAGRVPTAREISGFLDVSLRVGRDFRNDWLAAISPVTTTNQSEKMP